MDKLGGPTVQPPRIFDEQQFAAWRVPNNPAGGSTTLNVETIKDRVDVYEMIHFFSVVGSSSRQGSPDFAFVLNFPSDASVETNICLVGRTQPHDKPDKGMRIVVEVERRGVLNPAAVKVEESKVVPGDIKHTNKSSIRLFDEDLPGKTVSNVDNILIELWIYTLRRLLLGQVAPILFSRRHRRGFQRTS